MDRSNFLVLFYLAIVLFNSLFFYLLYIFSIKLLSIFPEFQASEQILYPVFCVAIVRGSDVLSIIVMLIGKPIFATLQQLTAIICLILLVFNYQENHLRDMVQINQMVWFEFCSIAAGQLLCIAIFTYWVSKRSSRTSQ